MYRFSYRICNQNINSDEYLRIFDLNESKRQILRLPLNLTPLL